MANKKLVAYEQLNKLAKGLYDKLHKEVMDHTTAVAAVLESDDARIKANATAIKALQDANAEGGAVANAIKAAKDAADAAQADVDALELKVGTVADGKTVVGLIAEAKAQADKGVADAAAAKGVADQAASDIASEIARATGVEEGLQNAINTLNGTADQDGSVAKAVTEAVAGAESRVANTYATKAELGTANQNISKAQGDITNLTNKVGEVPADKTVVGMIAEAKTEATYDDTALKNRVATIEADYLKSADKTELQGGISTASSAAATAQETADYAKGKIDAFLDANAVKDDTINTLKEIQLYIEEHGTEAAGMVQDIADNKKAIADEKTRAEAQEKAIRNEFAAADTALHTEISKEIDADVKVVQDALDVLEGVVGDAQSGLVQQVNTNKTDIGKLQSALGDVEQAASAKAVEEVKGEVQGIKDEIGTKAVAGETPVAATGLYKLIDDEAKRAKEAEAGLRTDVDALKTTVGNDGSGLVKKVADLEKEFGRVNHTHENKDTLDAITANVKQGYDDAVAKVTGNAATEGTIANAKKAGTDAQAAVNGLKLGVDLSDDTKAVVQLKTSADAVQSSVEIVYPYEFVSDKEIDDIIKGLGTQA